ncbi:acetyltransferase [uncultured Tateyamaria sp.]|uniref:acetyltransferase n=1 Tax=uncultured Tateyamaria sp. TaxID=455651 RepID=UPI002633788B|nr:acetyltransferase [uncultured Tateyamaria sp.]
MNSATKRILIWGGRAQSRLLHQMIEEADVGVIAVVFDPSLQVPTYDSAAEILFLATDLAAHMADFDSFAVAVGAEYGFARWRIAQELQSYGLAPLSLRHARAFCEPSAKIGAGLVMMPSSVVHKFSRLGEQCILNTGAVLDHECVLGNGVHLMGGCAVAGQVNIGDFATIGTNATVLPGLRIGVGAYVGAGAVVTRDIPDYAVAVGNPARVIRTQTLRLDEDSLTELKQAMAG